MSIDVGTSKQKEVEAKFMQRPLNGNTFQTKSLITSFIKRDMHLSSFLSKAL